MMRRANEADRLVMPSNNARLELNGQERAMKRKWIPRHHSTRSFERIGAEEGTRTPTVLPPLGPEPSASTNSATSAGAGAILAENNNRLSKKAKRTARPRRARTGRTNPRSTGAPSDDYSREILRELERAGEPLTTRKLA